MQVTLDDKQKAEIKALIFSTVKEGIQQVAKDYIKPGVEIDDKIFNLMEMVIRAYDPCLSCATHTMDSQMRLAEVDIVDSEGNIIKKF